MLKLANFPSNLFIDTPELHDSSRHQLSNDIESWPEDITQLLRERVPRASKLNTMVKFMNKDPENGAATGSITVNSPEKSAIVPFIIKDFALYPLDVMISRGKLLPLTPDYFDQVFDENQIFDGLEEFPTFGGLSRFEDANLWNAIYPPSLGRYAYASAGYPLLDAISDDIDGTPIKDAIIDDPTIAVGFKKHGHTELIKKLANLRPVNINEYRQSIDNLIPKSVIMVRQAHPNKYTIVSNPDKAFNPMVRQCTKEEFCTLLETVTTDPEDWVNDVDQNGIKVVNTPVNDKSVLAVPDTEHPEVASEYGYFSVRNQRGVSFKGVVIPKVIDLEMNPVDSKIFLSNNMGTIQAEIIGERMQNSHFCPVAACKGCMPSVGQSGTFVLLSQKNFDGCATTPMTVKTCVEEPGGQKKYSMCDFAGNDFKVKICAPMSVRRIAFDGDAFCIPGEMVWVPMEGFDQLDTNPMSYASKVAAEKGVGRNSVKIVHQGYGTYSVQGLDKQANYLNWDRTFLDKGQLHFLLATCDVSNEKVASLFERANKYGEAEIYNVNKKPLITEKQAGYKKVAEKLVKQAKALRRNLIKEASVMDNSQTVDTLLSLNFINPQTLSKFIGKIPQLKSTLSSLCSLALASRLGIEDIPENSVTTASQELINVIDGLENIRASQDTGK